MSNVITATITDASLFVAERNDAGLVCQTLVNEDRPASFAAADQSLAFASLGRTSAWELTADGCVEATVAPVDNRFGGTVAARLDQAVGTTHEPFDVAAAGTVQDGDLISDIDRCGEYVVAGSSVEGDWIKIHQVAEGKNWEDRYTGHFRVRQLVMVARKR